MGCSLCLERFSPRPIQGSLLLVFYLSAKMPRLSGQQQGLRLLCSRLQPVYLEQWLQQDGYGGNRDAPLLRARRLLLGPPPPRAPCGHPNTGSRHLH